MKLKITVVIGLCACPTLVSCAEKATEAAAISQRELTTVQVLPRSTSDKTPKPASGLLPHTGGKITNIVIHHTQTPNEAAAKAPGRIASIFNWHTKDKPNPWKDIAYHYFIAPDGKIFQGRDSRFQTDTGAAYPRDGALTVTLLGDFSETLPSSAALDTLVSLTRQKMAGHGLDPAAVSTHGKLAGGKTTCPGPKLQQWLDTTGKKRISESSPQKTRIKKKS